MDKLRSPGRRDIRTGSKIMVFIINYIRKHNSNGHTNCNTICRRGDELYNYKAFRRFSGLNYKISLDKNNNDS